MTATPAEPTVRVGPEVAPGGRLLGIGLTLGSMVAGQGGAALAVLLFPRVGAEGVVTLRLILASAMLLAISRPGLRGRTRRDWLLVALFAVVLTAMNSLFYQSIARIPLAAAVTVEVLGPLALSVLIARRAVNWLCALLAAAGVVLLGRSGFGHLDPVGVAFALGAAVMWASYIVLSSRVGRRFAGTQGLALAMAGAAVLSLPLGIARGGAGLLVPQTVGLAVGVAALSSALPYALEMLALRRIPTALFAVMMSLLPALSAAVGLVVLGQAVTALDSVAIGLVVVASGAAARLSAVPARRTPVPIEP